MKRRKLEPGFTLLELLVASAIAAVVLLGALSVLGLLSRDRIRAAGVRSEPAKGLTDLFQRDIVNARQVLGPVDKAPIRLMGFDASEADQHPGRGRPVEIVYEIAGTKDHSLLVRRQRYLDEPSDHQRWVSEVAAFGIKAMSLDLATQKPATIPSEQAASISGVLLDKKVTITLTRSDNSTSAYAIQRY